MLHYLPLFQMQCQSCVQFVFLAKSQKVEHHKELYAEVRNFISRHISLFEVHSFAYLLGEGRYNKMLSPICSDTQGIDKHYQCLPEYYHNIHLNALQKERKEERRANINSRRTNQMREASKLAAFFSQDSKYMYFHFVIISIDYYHVSTFSLPFLLSLSQYKFTHLYILCMICFKIVIQQFPLTYSVTFNGFSDLWTTIVQNY